MSAKRKIRKHLIKGTIFFWCSTLIAEEKPALSLLIDSNKTEFTCSNQTAIACDIDEAQKIAIETNKKILVVAKIEGCPKCAYMQNIAMKTEENKKILNENFVILFLYKGDHLLIDELEPLVFPSFFYQIYAVKLPALAGRYKAVDNF